MTTTVINMRDLPKQGHDEILGFLDPYVYIGRPSKWGNPFKVGKTSEPGIKFSREEAITEYKQWFCWQFDLYEQIDELYGKILVCWCKPLACHGDVLAAIADGDLVLFPVERESL